MDITTALAASRLVAQQRVMDITANNIAYVTSDPILAIVRFFDSRQAAPVAILGYRIDGTPGSALWPFASYSPEM